MHIFLIALGIITIAATLLSLLKHEAWWIRTFDFPRLQILVMMALILAAYGGLRPSLEGWNIAFVGAMAAAMIYQSVRIFPYTRLAKPIVQRSEDPRPETTLKLLFANVEMTNRTSARIKEIVHQADPDIFLALETDAWWLAELAEFDERYPYKIKQPQENYYGMILYSRLELIDPLLKFLIEDDIPSIHTTVKLQSGQKICLHCLHPRPPLPGSQERSTERDAELLVVGRAIRQYDEHAIVMGDFNDVAWSHTSHLFQRISGMLDPRVGRGFYNSFHARYPLIRFPLDHYFHSNHFRLVNFQRLPAFGSDHFPMFITLSYEPEASVEQHGEEADQADQEEASEKIEEAIE